jgi:ribose transport system permease protein
VNTNKLISGLRRGRLPSEDLDHREADGEEGRTPHSSQFARFAERYALLGAWLLIIVVFSILRPSTFFTMGNFETIFGSQSVLVVMTLAAILPLIVGEFDLSIGANLGFSAVFIAVMSTEHGWSIWLASFVALLNGTLIGTINAVLVVVIGVDALVATLGIGTLLQGIGYALTNYIIVAGVDERIVSAVSNTLFGLPYSFYYGIGLAALLAYMLSFTPLGRHLRFTGVAPEVARLSGLNVRSLRMGAFISCGLISSAGGVILLGTFGSADPNNGLNFLLPAFAAAFLGATTISPGEFNPWGAVVAVYFLVTGITGLQLLGLREWIQDVFYGGSLVLAVTLARSVSRKNA